MRLSTGTPKNINFSFETNGKLMALGVPILKHFRVHIIHSIEHLLHYLGPVLIGLSPGTILYLDLVPWGTVLCLEIHGLRIRYPTWIHFRFKNE